MQTPDIILSFLAGLLSFLSPCVFPLVPAYIGYMGGPAIMAARGAASPGGTTTMSTEAARWTVMAHAFLFVLGLTIVFGIIFGSLAGALSDLLRSPENKLFLQRVMGVLLIAFGLHSIGLINVPIFNYTRHVEVRMSRNFGYLRSLLIGMAFAFGLGPCTSFQLGLILTLAQNGAPEQAFLPFVVYALGLGLPFLLVATAMGQISVGLKKLTRRGYTLKIGRWTAIDQVNIVSLVSGVILVIMGLFAVTDTWTYLSKLALPFTLPEL